MLRGRPKKPSYRTFQLIYARLVKSPLWIEDWASTRVKSRWTVYKCLRHLESKGLVVRRRAGHKILYELVPLQTKEGIITHEGILWHSVLYLLSRKEKRQIRRHAREHARELAELEKQLAIGTKLSIHTQKKLDKIIELPKSREVFDALGKAGLDWKRIPIPNLLKILLYPNLDETLCLDCLKKGLIVYLVTDFETGEVICARASPTLNRAITSALLNFTIKSGMPSVS